MYKILLSKTYWFVLFVACCYFGGDLFVSVLLMCSFAYALQMSDVHPYRFRLKTVDRVYRFAVDTSGVLLSCHVIDIET